jgi:hypothetical protein
MKTAFVKAIPGLLLWLAIWIAGMAISDLWLGLSGSWMAMAGVVTWLVAEFVAQTFAGKFPAVHFDRAIERAADTLGVSTCYAVAWIGRKDGKTVIHGQAMFTVRPWLTETTLKTLRTELRDEHHLTGLPVMTHIQHLGAYLIVKRPYSARLGAGLGSTGERRKNNGTL